MGGSPARARKDRLSGEGARYVGRVGGLAFALGIGAAVLTGTAVASAETPDADSAAASSSASSSSGDRTDRPDRGSAPSKTRSAKPSDAASESESESAKADESDTLANGTDSDEQAGDDSVVEGPDEAPAEDDSSSLEEDVDVLSAGRMSAELATTRAPAAAEPDEPNSFEVLFSNKTPTLDHNPLQNAVIRGQVVGILHPEDPDSTRLTYTATRPQHGTVDIDDDGTFYYTPGSTYAGQDTFQVTVSDEPSGFHLHGFEGLLNLFTFGLLGNSGHRTTETVFIGFERATVVSGLNSPVDFRFLPDGRILVAEKGGAIRVVQNGTLLAQPAITLAVRTEFERGIGGLAVDPDFTDNGRIYVSYISSADNRNTLSRLIMTGNTASLDDVLIRSTIDSAVNHHGGALGFGPDGKLYWGVGDNATGANAQNLDNIHGKILRLNTDGSIPTDNPVLNGVRSHIYAYGLRNPFRLTFTPTGELLVADVGAAAFEEVNRVNAGGNYGWPSSEGICTSSCAGKTDPIYTYPRGGGAAITSVTVYLDKVFIADTVQGWIKVLTCTPEYTSCGDVQTFDPDAGATVVLAERDGNLYQLTYSPGELIRIKPTGGGATSV